MSRKDRYKPRIQPCAFTAKIRESGGAIIFSIDSTYSELTLFKEIEAIPELVILKRETIYQSFGPIERQEEITTSLGTFNLHSTLEGMYDGFILHTNDSVLISLIIEKLRKSASFYQKPG